MFLKINNSKSWNFGNNVELHFVEINNKGKVIRLIDVDSYLNIINSSPNHNDMYSAMDHAPFDMSCDWKDYEITKELFESYWSKTH